MTMYSPATVAAGTDSPMTGAVLAAVDSTNKSVSAPGPSKVPTPGTSVLSTGGACTQTDHSPDTIIDPHARMNNRELK